MSLIHTVAYGCMVFIPNAQYSIAWPYHDLCVYAAADGRSSSFHFTAVTNYASIHTLVHIFGDHVYQFLLNPHPGVESPCFRT